MWVYQFTKHQIEVDLPNLIAGLSKQMAIDQLEKQPGVDKSKPPTIDITGGGDMLPKQPGEIHIMVLTVEGFKATPTPTTGPSGPTSTGTSATPTPVNGNGSAGSSAGSGAGS